jgi:DNA-directed RNA polymerase subunit L
MKMEVKILKDEPGELSFELIGADQSLAQVLVEKLNQEKSVEFAASKVAHPLVANPSVIVKTKRVKAKDLVVKTLEGMKKETEEFRKKFSDLIR